MDNSSLSLGTVRSKQTVQIQIRLLLQEHSDQATLRAPDKKEYKG